LLLRAATTGRHLRSAVLSVVTVGDRPLLQTEITLEDVQVTGYEIYTDAADARPHDLVGLAFAKITHSFRSQNDDGSAGETVTTSWNFKTNSST
jgi:type VI protein secretion system component Hcp